MYRLGISAILCKSRQIRESIWDIIYVLWKMLRSPRHTYCNKVNNQKLQMGEIYKESSRLLKWWRLILYSQFTDLFSCSKFLLQPLIALNCVSYKILKLIYIYKLLHLYSNWPMYFCYICDHEYIIPWYVVKTTCCLMQATQYTHFLLIIPNGTQHLRRKNFCS